MNEFVFLGVVELPYNIVSSSMKIIHPVTRKRLVREIVESSIEGVVKSLMTKVLILKDTTWYIHMSISILWPVIFKYFFRKEIPKDEEC